MRSTHYQPEQAMHQIHFWPAYPFQKLTVCTASDNFFNRFSPKTLTSKMKLKKSRVIQILFALILVMVFYSIYSTKTQIFHRNNGNSTQTHATELNLNVESNFTEIQNTTEDSPKFVQVTLDIPCEEINGRIRTKPRSMIVDYILFSQELDMLEIRLFTIESKVDYFIIAESNTTFSGKPKKLHFDINKDNAPFKTLKHKIIHVILPDYSKNVTPGWDIEHASRKDGLIKGLAMLPVPLKIDDVIIDADLDEIPRPSTIDLLNKCQDYHKLMSYTTLFYYYSFEYRHYGSDWSKSKFIVYEGNEYMKLTRIDAESLRMTGSPTIQNAGWHCTWCFATTDQVVQKITGYSHFEHAEQRFMEKTHILDHYRHGFDLFHRYCHEV